MLKKSLVVLGLSVMGLSAHFLTLIPESPIVEEGNKKQTVKIAFMHPFELVYMKLAKPTEVGVVLNGKKESLLSKITKSGETWSFDYTFKRPGDYIFYVDPQPYFEPAEAKFIRQQTKVIISAFGKQEGWDEPIGLEAEIIPLSRPYGLWQGNIFGGQVLLHGKPVKFAEIEVEYYNKDGKKSPGEGMIPQVVKTDENGIFYYAMPFEGWWGFAALLEGDKPLKYSDGKSYPVELGAVIWVKTYKGD